MIYGKERECLDQIRVNVTQYDKKWTVMWKNPVIIWKYWKRRNSNVAVVENGLYQK